MRVTVIGAGILGTTLGYRLARAGIDTTIVDGDREPSGASWASFAWLNANGKQPASYFELNRAGMQATFELAQDLGDGNWHHPVGSIEIATSDQGGQELIARAERQAAAGYRASRLSPADLRHLEPSLAVETRSAMTAVLFEDEGWLDTAGLIARARERAAADGADLRLGSRVIAIEPDDAPRLTSADGRSWVADVVVNAAGADAGAVSMLAGGCLPSTSGTLGLTSVTGPLPQIPGRVLRWPGGTARAHPGGGVMVASTSVVDARLAEQRDAALDGALASEAVSLAAAFLPILADAPVESVRVTRRAVPDDGMPVAGHDPARPWLYHLVTHSGVTLAALLSRLVAEELAEARVDERLAAYRPSRFVV